MDAAHSQNSTLDDSDSAVVYPVTKGRDGRFVSTGSTSGSNKRCRTGDDLSWIVKEPVPGGPVDGSVIPSFLGHVASRMWRGEMRGILKCQNRLAVCQRLRDWYGRMPEEARQMIDGTGLSHLHTTMFSHVDTPLICAFVERWQPDTNSFHMPFGEMTIMMHDVWHILRLPVEGQMISADPSISKLKSSCITFLGLTEEDLKAHWQSGSFFTESIFGLCTEGRIYETEAIAWMWVLVASTLFVDKSRNRIRPNCLHEFQNGLEDVQEYSWGSATLAYLYRQLGVASRGDCQGLAGCLTLLQAWIYEYFPCFRPHGQRLIVDPDSPRACTWSVRAEDRSKDRLQSLRIRLDQLTPFEVMWLPYGPNPASFVRRTIFTGWLRYRDVIEPYMPARVLRQLGYVQAIPNPITRPMKAVRPWASIKYKVEHPDLIADDFWRGFPSIYVLPLGDYVPTSEDPAACAPEYLAWYHTHSHPRLLSDRQSSAVGTVSRSNSEYWVNRLFNWGRNVVGDVADEEAKTTHVAGLDQIMKDWHLAN